jgi:ABC-type phosphate transport system auxiliary subunit
MNLQDAMKIADKLGISIDEFDFKDGKFYLNEQIDPQKVEEAYLKWNGKLKTQLDNDYKAIIGAEEGFVSADSQTLKEAVDKIKSTKNWNEKEKDEKIEILKESFNDNAETILDLYD